MMKFGDLKENQQFTRKSSLIWTKCKPFTAYGDIHNQNTAAHHYGWHYDKINDDEIVILKEPTNVGNKTL